MDGVVELLVSDGRSKLLRTDEKIGRSELEEKSVEAEFRRRDEEAKSRMFDVLPPHHLQRISFRRVASPPSSEKRLQVPCLGHAMASGRLALCDEEKWRNAAHFDLGHAKMQPLDRCQSA